MCELEVEGEELPGVREGREGGSGRGHSVAGCGWGGGRSRSMDRGALVSAGRKVEHPARCWCGGVGHTTDAWGVGALESFTGPARAVTAKADAGEALN